jgi:HK97 family phage prohead protease
MEKAAMPATKPNSDARESRAIIVPLELRSAAADGDGSTASGYAAVFNSKTDVGGYFTETISPGAFKSSLQTRDVIAVHSHDTGRVVGRLKAGTLSLREDDKGLAFENPLPDTTDGRDLVVQIGRGDIAGMSFAFRAAKQEWDETVDPPHRTIIEAELYEITYTPFPQYPDTDVALRSLEGARDERRQHNRTAGSIRISQRKARQAQLERRIG